MTINTVAKRTIDVQNGRKMILMQPRLSPELELLLHRHESHTIRFISFNLLSFWSLPEFPIFKIYRLVQHHKKLSI